MKRFWLVLLTLGLIAAFSTQAMAVDVKFSGEYYAAGMYMDKTTLKKDMTGDGLSTAFYFQRLRLNTTFVIHPGLYLNTRADIMERAWGASRTSPGTALDQSGLSAGTPAENENIAFDLAYLTYVSPIGVFLAGYQIDGVWGTIFGDNSYPTGRIGYMFKTGGFSAMLLTGKNAGGENSYTAKNPNLASDRDNSFYTAYAKYEWKTGEAGLLFKYIDNRTSRNATDPYTGLNLPFGSKTQTLSTLPYAKLTLGPVALQTEVIYTYGRVTFEEDANTALGLLGQPDKIDVDMLSLWLDATADFGIAYIGGTFAYLSGDDPGTKDKKEGGAIGGYDWNPCLIMFNSNLSYWAGGQSGFDNSINAGPMSNAWFFQAKVGVRPVDKLNIMATIAYANADKKPSAAWLYNDYGYEVDLTANYKITNNLSYMLGGGYLFAGKYFKGTIEGNQLQDNFLVINKLTLTF